MTLVRENWSTWRKTCPAAALSTTSSMWCGLESNAGLYGERLVANYLRAMTKPFTDIHYTAFSQVCMLIFIMFPCYNITNILLTCYLKHSLLLCNVNTFSGANGEDVCRCIYWATLVCLPWLAGNQSAWHIGGQSCRHIFRLHEQVNIFWI